MTTRFTTRRLRFLASFLSLAIVTSCASAAEDTGANAAGPSLRLTDKGITIQSGDLKGNLAYPLPYSAAKVKGKISEKSVTADKATLKYDGGGQIEITTTGGEIALQASNLPADTKSIYFTMRLDAAAAANGKWQLDGKSGTFPGKDAGIMIHQATARNLSIATKEGQNFSLALPAASFQQLQDLRQFNTREFYWQCWLPAAAEKLTIKVAAAIGENPVPASTPPVASPAASASPASAPAAPAKATPPAAANDRQKWGQMGGTAEGKKTGTRILRYQGGKKAAFMLAFDDCYGTHLKNVIPELEKRKMVGNFYVNPGSPQWKKNLAQWQEAAKSPYVVLHNHSFTHYGVQSAEECEADLLKTSEAIYEITPHLKKPRLLAFRQPGGCPWKVEKKDMSAILAKLHLANRPWLDGPGLTMKSQAEVLATVDTALSRGELGFVDFHGVGGDGIPAPLEWFAALMEKLQAHRENLWITDAVSWHKYHAQRKNAELKMLKSDAAEVRASLTCSSDPVYFDQPLTVAIEVPAGWSQCTVTQGAKVWETAASAGEVRMDVVPGSEELVIRPKS